MRSVQSKPVTLRQVAFEAVLEGESRSSSPELEEPTHVEEQQVLRDETIAAFHDAVASEGEDADDESDDGGGVLVPREKTKDELEREEEDYRAFLEKEVGSDLDDLITVEKAAEKSSDVEGDAEKKKKKKKSQESKAKSKEQEDHEFLMRYAVSISNHTRSELFLSYILNRGWIDKSSRHIPTYKEVTSSIKSRSKAKAKSPTAPASESDSGLDSDASFESLNDHFEASYNFRFEEPGAATVQAFPRNLPDTVRRQDSTRKDARARRRERKEAELEQKRQELGRLKNLKMKEVRQKLEKIGTEGGRHTNVDEDQGGFKVNSSSAPFLIVIMTYSTAAT